MTDAKRRLVERLKRCDSATAGELAADLGLTDTAVRQHLDVLERAGLVRRSAGTAVGRGRGRPAVRWQLTTDATAVFPDRHAELTVELIDIVRAELGDAALDQVLDARASRQTSLYMRDMDGATLDERVRLLARRRSDEGYLADVLDEGDSLVLVEHHCPIAAAATVCGSVCRTELEVFRTTLGDDAVVTREQHLLAGDQRCSYRISRR